jgi:hypothetical protein
LLPGLLDYFVEVLSKSFYFSRGKSFRLACSRIVLVVMFKAEESQVVRAVVGCIAIKMGDLASLDRNIAREAVANAASPSA